MGTILIGHGRGRVDIDECHINFWALPGWPDELHYLDIGLYISNASDTPVETIRLGIPARLPECEAVCLVTTINDPTSWHLIFRDLTKIELEIDGPHWNRTLMRSNRAFTMTGVNIAADAATTETAGEFSLWNVSLQKPLPPQGRTYLRVRFRIKKSLGARLGALHLSKDLGIYERVRTYDIRVNEMREQVDLTAIAELFRDRPRIKQLFVFVVTKPDLTPRVVSPAARYVRSLEATGWESYLQRRLRFRWTGTPRKLLIYSWRSDWGAPSDAEFRAFASFHRDLGRIDVPSVSIGAVLTLLAIGVAQPGWIAAAASAIACVCQQFPVPASIIAGIVLVPSLAILASRVVKRLADTVDTIGYEISL